MQIGTVHEQTLLGEKSGVPHEQHAEISVRKHDDYRVLIDVILAVGEQRAARRKDRQRDAVVGCQLVAAPCDVDRNLMHRRFAAAVVEGATAILLAAIRDRIDLQRSDDRREPSDVIAVGNLSTLLARLLIAAGLPLRRQVRAPGPCL